MECRNLMGQTVLPVFYYVRPSDVRGQKGSFQAALKKHEVKLAYDIEKVKRWREALVTAASLCGWDVPRTDNGREAECIKHIVRTILSYIESRCLDNMIGMESRVQHVKSLLGKGCDDFCMIGIWGMGGIGKTSIARAVYHQVLYEFEGGSFLGGVRENGSDKKGLKTLQEKLLSEILLEKHFEVKDCDDGICQIQIRLGLKKVLVVLDDVDNMEQLEFLVGVHDCHTGHLPLALKVLGSHFSGRNLEFWQSALNVLAKVPHKEINGILKISFDGLNILEKKIFLHIACFFKGWDRHYVTRILDCCGFEAVSGITLLIEKSLLTVSHGHLHMHDLIQDMGRFVVSECYPYNMVWCPEEIEEVMTTSDRFETVEAIVETFRDGYMYNAEAFKSMKKLSLLQVIGRFTLSEPTYFPKQLRWGILTNLKFIDLRGSRSITSSPDVSGIPNLEYLNLSQCDHMKEVHQSVMLHERTMHLHLDRCFSLQILPLCIKMNTLQTLALYGCESLHRFPEISKETGKLLVLNMGGCNLIRRLPSSFRLLTGLTILVISYDYYTLESCYMGMAKRCLQIFTHLRSLRVLDLQRNNFVENRIFLANMLMKFFVHKCVAVNHRLSIAVPGRKIPNWFNNQCLGNVITMNLPQNQITKMTGLAICCIFGPLNKTLKLSKLFIKFKPSGNEKLIDLPTRGTKGRHVTWIGYMSTDFLWNLCHGFESNDLIFEFMTSSMIIKCGGCVVHKVDIKSLTGTGTWIPDYDELEMVYKLNLSGKGLPNGRCSVPTFSIEHEATGHISTVSIWFKLLRLSSCTYMYP
ncbi:hypothetical protein L1987_75440 [Smallanthus sonchifolius]|uniref:Uncharacterized protein n=1 Tax=Smallanthus sonchifolius TaxID=185202 RepID=A0ACB9A6P3_9ASTR|nr:hypothetical protein L1987_75440 [Smallanthus sonchifolius]